MKALVLENIHPVATSRGFAQSAAALPKHTRCMGFVNHKDRVEFTGQVGQSYERCIRPMHGENRVSHD